MSTIEWTDETWNPVTGCTKVSTGCAHCYAEGVANRFWGGRKFTDVQCHPDRLDKPLRWRKPRKVFVNSMSDLFHEDVPDEFIYRVWRIMAQAGAHTFQVLTKRPKRMREWFAKLADVGDPAIPPVMWRAGKYAETFGATREQAEAIRDSGRCTLFHAFVESLGPPPDGGASPTYDWQGGDRYWPTLLPNVWLGVSIEDQATADERIPLLLRTPAAVRFVSAEPLLGPINICAVPDRACRPQDFSARYTPLGDLDWVIVGGESGPKARPMHPDWARSIRDQCVAAGVPFFFKQLGGHPDRRGDMSEWPEDLRVREFPPAFGG